MTAEAAHEVAGVEDTQRVKLRKGISLFDFQGSEQIRQRHSMESKNVFRDEARCQVCGGFAIQDAQFTDEK